MQFKLGFLNHPSVLLICVLGIWNVSYSFGSNFIAPAAADLKGPEFRYGTRRVEGRGANVDCSEGQQELEKMARGGPRRRGQVPGLLGREVKTWASGAHDFRQNILRAGSNSRGIFLHCCTKTSFMKKSGSDRNDWAQLLQLRIQSQVSSVSPHQSAFQWRMIYPDYLSSESLKCS